MMTPYLMHDTDRHGNERWYYRRPGQPKIRLPRPGTREFRNAYLEAAAGIKSPQSRPGQGTIAAAIRGYYQHNSFTTLAPASQTHRRGILKRFQEKYGAGAIDEMLPSHVAMILGKLGPFAARNWIKSIRALMQFAVATGLRDDDPTAGVKLPSAKTDGFHTWTEDEIAQYEAYHPIGSQARLAMALLLYTAARRADAIQFGPQHIKAGVLTYRQQKTGVRLNIPMHAKLIETIAETPIEHLTFLVARKGAPYTSHGFGERFRSWCRKAGLTICSAHGLRKAAARRLAEAGCTGPQIAAITGHKTLAQVQHYIEAAEQTTLAEAAIKTVSGT